MANTKKHIIMADDDSDDVHMFQEMANDHCPHLKITVAGNGIELLELLKIIPIPDAILLDILVPAGSPERDPAVRSGL